MLTGLMRQLCVYLGSADQASTFFRRAVFAGTETGIP